MITEIRKIGVVGNGTMGMGIAMAGAACGLMVELINPLHQTSPFYIETVLNRDEPGIENIHLSHLDEAEKTLADCDVVLEAVAEDLGVKKAVLGVILKNTSEETVVGTNTSTIPINALAEGFSTDLKKRFMGIHFFNPVKHMKLVELIPNRQTDQTAVDLVQAFVSKKLGKEPIICRDTPGFIANRYGAWVGLSAMRIGEKYGYSANKTDTLVGQVMLRPKTGIYRLTDMVGLDVEYHSDLFMTNADIPEWERQYWKIPKRLEELFLRKYLGDKTNGGFYKRTEAGIMVWDFDECRYVARTEETIPCLVETEAIENSVERLKTILERDDEESRFIKEILKESFWFAEQCVGMICDEPESIDRAMKYGYNWELGPFELKRALSC